MAQREWSKLWFDSQLSLGAYQAVCVKRGFPSHMHDYYVFCYIENGLQSFSHRKKKYLTPPGGLILLNPGDAHTGEPADKYGFEYRAIYPTLSHMEDVLTELDGKRQGQQDGAPAFRSVRIDDPELAGCFRALHMSLADKTSPMERESLFLTVLSKAVLRYAEIRPKAINPRQERHAVKRACDYICDRATEGISLTEVAGHVNLSRYYFLRIFHKEIGMPPHAYLESVRIGKAKQLLEKGLPLNEVAHQSGFSDQSHFTHRFKRFIGVTPGQYVRGLRLGEPS